jgi:hypothetical protein
LQALEPINSPSEASVSRSLTAKNSVEIILLGNDALCQGNFESGVTARLYELLDKIDSCSRCMQSEDGTLPVS